MNHEPNPFSPKNSKTIMYLFNKKKWNDHIPFSKLYCGRNNP